MGERMVFGEARLCRALVCGAKQLAVYHEYTRRRPETMCAGRAAMVTVITARKPRPSGRG